MALELPVLGNNTLYMQSQARVANFLDPDGRVAKIAEVLTQSNEILQDIPYYEGNLPTGHRVTIRTGLPKAYWKRMNQGVPSSTSSVAQVEETCGICQARSRIDEHVVNLNGNRAEFRAQEDRAFIEAMNQTMCETLFYGNKSNNGPDGFVGLTPRYNSLSSTVQSSKNVIDCGGTGTKLTSIWMVGWGENTVFGIYPKGTKVGLDVKDKGLVTVDDENGYPFEAYETVYTWQNGLVVKDWRYIVRLCNVDVDELMNGTGMGTGDLKAPNSNNLILQMNNALAKFPTTGTAKVCIYMNSDVHAALNNIAVRANTNVIQLQTGLNAFGTHTSWSTYLGYPMRRVDVLRNNEKKVS